MTCRLLASTAALMLLGVPDPGTVLQARQTAPLPFRFERPVTAPPGTAVRLPVDMGLLAGSVPFTVTDARTDPGAPPAPVARGGLADLRLFDEGGREIPYLLIEPASAEPRWRMAETLAIAPTKTSSGFEVDLQAPTAIDRMRLDGVAAPFLKRVSLEGSGDRLRWTLLVAEATVFDLPDQQMADRLLAFEPGEFQYLRLTWDDRSSARVALPGGVSVRLAGSTPPRDPDEATVPFARRPSEPRRSRFRVTLPAARLPVVGLRLEVGETRLMRAAQVTESRLAGAGAEPVLLGRGVLARAGAGDLTASALRVPIAQPTQAWLDLVVDDGDNPPLDLRRVVVELAALPWIYLETPRVGPVTARYGQPRLTAPHYDLEAARDRVAAADASEGAWGPVVPVAPGPTAPAPLALPATGATIDPASFRFSRPIPPGPPGLVSLEIDAQAMAHSAGPDAAFRDVRIADAEDRQIPYLVERCGEPTIVALRAERIASESGERRAGGAVTSRYRIRLPDPRLPAGWVVVRTRATVFERRVTLSAEIPPADARSQARRVVLASELWRHASETGEATALSLPFAPIPTAEVRLDIAEGDNQPLPISSVDLLLPGARLRFYRSDGARLRLLYGAPDLPPPQYDLQLLAATVLQGVAEDASPGPEQEQAVPGVSAGPSVPPALFYGILGGAAFALLAMIARALRGHS